MQFDMQFALDGARERKLVSVSLSLSFSLLSSLIVAIVLCFLSSILVVASDGEYLGVIFSISHTKCVENRDPMLLRFFTSASPEVFKYFQRVAYKNLPIAIRDRSGSARFDTAEHDCTCLSPR